MLERKELLLTFNVVYEWKEKNKGTLQIRLQTNFS